MILSLVLGDGCLFNMKRGNKLYGGLTIDHGIKQKDYQIWKAELLSNITGRKVRIRQGHKGKSVQISVCMKRFRSWRKFLYPNGKKDISRILKFINNPIFATAVWLMDDGYVETSFSKLADGSKKNYGARFRLFTCETSVEDQDKIIKWFEKELKVKPKVRLQKKGDKKYPFLAFNSQDTKIIWKEIRKFVLRFDSMKYKFRHIEEIYQKEMSQCKAGYKPEDIVRHS
ncbi:MAG: hypothetical protein HRU26_07470 [Psychroserpens sp.]|nr:hypothetical protein [Psychroserpens sp.]